jgi:hypothetical protein
MTQNLPTQLLLATAMAAFTVVVHLTGTICRLAICPRIIDGSAYTISCSTAIS